MQKFFLVLECQNKLHTNSLYIYGDMDHKSLPGNLKLLDYKESHSMHEKCMGLSLYLEKVTYAFLFFSKGSLTSYNVIGI